MKTHIIFLALAVLFGALITTTEGCSCMPSHPQEQYCQSDFVILARIRKESTQGYTRVYKAKIRKEFKMSEKARIALKSGKLLTPLEGSMCGVYLEPGKLYLITGRIYGLQAHVNLCGFYKPWKDVTNRQRKGFRLLYGKGCSCKLTPIWRLPSQKDGCTYSNTGCQSKYGICLRSPTGKCHWSKSLDLQKCLKGDAIEEKPQIVPEPLYRNKYDYLQKRNT